MSFGLESVWPSPPADVREKVVQFWLTEGALPKWSFVSRECLVRGGGISLGQLATEEKSNEVTAIPELIDTIDVSNAIVTIDAAGCQKNIAAKIVDSGGDYVLALKGNQGHFYRDVYNGILDLFEDDFAGVTSRYYEEVVKGHGRMDHLMYYHISVPDSLPGRNNWKSLRTIGVAIRISEKDG